MNLLLDTHILLWWLESSNKLTENIVSTIENTRNNVFISSAAIWEIVIKKQIGKLQAPDNLLEILDENNFTTLSITADHVMALEDLPEIHNDPFDRIQIVQAIHDQMILVSVDQKIWKYKVNILDP
ncbi:type II toxin-antitoxin system VapC family toxin [Bacteroidota bacterium]